MKVLLHVCCGPCSTAVIERLSDHDLTLFFAGSNISPYEEYERRLEAAATYAHKAGMPFIEDTYDHTAWLHAVRQYTDAPEGKERCAECFRFNLMRTAAYARKHGFDAWTTTLTVSPHKDAATIFAIAEGAGRFLAIDFKKRDGFRRSVELSKLHAIYRQDYCGCEFSTRKE